MANPVDVLKQMLTLEQKDGGYADKAVFRGLASHAEHWEKQALEQYGEAGRPWVEDVALRLRAYTARPEDRPGILASLCTVLDGGPEGFRPGAVPVGARTVQPSATPADHGSRPSGSSAEALPSAARSSAQRHPRPDAGKAGRGLAAPVSMISGIGPRGASYLEKLGVQTIRDLLDAGRLVIVCRETELLQALSKLNEKPAIVITDSQAFKTVNELTPPDIPLTGFSVLFARLQGDLNEMTRGALAIDRLKPGDKVLIAEACAHHPVHEDIGTVKIPRMLNRYVGGELQFEWTHGRDFPDDLADFKLIINCGACTWNRRAVLSRILRAQEAGVPITNYGLCIAYSLKIFDRALEPFPLAREIYRNHLLARQNAP